MGKGKSSGKSGGKAANQPFSGGQGDPPKAEGGKKYSPQDDKDGTTVGTEEELSAQKLARAQLKDPNEPLPADYMTTWKNAVMAALAKDKRFAREAQYLRDQDWVNQTPGEGPDAFADIVGGKFYKNGTASSESVYKNYFYDAPKGDIHHPRGMAKDLVRLLDDPAWQPITSVARVMPDGSLKSADPYKANYVVANTRTGIAEVTNPDTGETYVGPTDDTNGAAFGGDGSDTGEMSHALTEKLPAGKKAQITLYRNTAGNGTPGYLTNDEWKEALGYIKKGWKINNRADLLKARAGGMLLLYGYWSVAHGQDQRAVGYADTLTTHQGGGFVKEGSDRTFVGDGLFPLSRVGDATSDNFTIATGALDFYVGGIPTTARPMFTDYPAGKEGYQQYKADDAKWKRTQAAYNPFYIPTK